MPSRIQLDILPQPDDTTCGPTCLHAVYRHLGLDLVLSDVIREVPSLEDGGTLAVSLARHALRRGMKTRLYSCNLHVFDPTWFDLKRERLIERLNAYHEVRADDARLARTIRAYRDYLVEGGDLRFSDVTPSLVRHHLRKGRPILTGLSATWLYRSARERSEDMVEDDLHGSPQGHFVVLCGQDPSARTVDIADPLHRNPIGDGPYYTVPMERLISAIHLGILTYDCNLLTIEGGDQN